MLRDEFVNRAHQSNQFSNYLWWLRQQGFEFKYELTEDDGRWVWTDGPTFIVLWLVRDTNTGLRHIQLFVYVENVITDRTRLMFDEKLNEATEKFLLNCNTDPTIYRG